MRYFSSAVMILAGTVMIGFSSGDSAAQSRADTARNAPRIFYGRDVLPGEGPWAVRLTLTADDGKVFNCGGSFIDPIVDKGKVTGWRSDTTEPRWVVTAAHCVDIEAKTVRADQLSALGGTRDLSAGGEPQKVVAVIKHKGFDPDTLKNDIALLVLASAAKELDSARRRSIRLPDTADGNWINERYLAVYPQGWGQKETGTNSLTLQETLLPLVDQTDCSAKFGQFGQEIFPGMICAGFASGGFDSCQGDSGGPLIYRPLGSQTRSHRSGVPVLVGAVS